MSQTQIENNAFNKIIENIHEMNILAAKRGLVPTVEVEATKQAKERMQEHELLYTQGIAESEKWFKFVESLARTCKNCRHCHLYIDGIRGCKGYICLNSMSKYFDDYVVRDWTCDCFGRKGETDGNSIMDNSSLYGD